MNISAIQHQAFDNYCYPLDEDFLEINIKTAKDVDKIFLVYGDPFEGGILGGNWKWEGTTVEITQKKELQIHYLWTAEIKPPFKRARYYFKIISGKECIYFMENGFFTQQEFETSPHAHGHFTFPWMNPSDICKVPSWAEKTVWYQIFPARFCRGKTDYVPENLKEWAPFGTVADSRSVYGGNLRGIIEKLDYLKDLGITGIYTTPINQSESQHKYDTTDYYKVDESFGTNADLKELVQKAHERNIKIMFDGVFNHSGSFFKQWQDVWQNKEKSIYKDWFMINNFDFCKPSFGKNSNAAKGNFFTFAFVDGMPKLNTNNPEVIKFIIDVCRFWITEYDIDGLRLDVANEVSHLFCAELRKALRALKPDFYILGEIWHNSQVWLRGTEFDSVMNYPLQNSIADFCCAENLSVKQFEQSLNRCFSMYYKQVNKVLFNQMDSHDTIRILNRAEKNKTRAWQSISILFAMPGSACLYYGTEIMLEGGHDPDCRRCMPWKELESGMFNEDLDFCKRLIALRKSNSALISPDFYFEYEKSDPDGKNRIMHIIKTSEDKSEKIGLIVDATKDALNAEDLCSKFNIKKDSVLLSRKGIVFYKKD